MNTYRFAVNLNVRVFIPVDADDEDEAYTLYDDMDFLDVLDPKRFDTEVEEVDAVIISTTPIVQLEPERQYVWHLEYFCESAAEAILISVGLNYGYYFTLKAAETAMHAQVGPRMAPLQPAEHWSDNMITYNSAAGDECWRMLRIEVKS